MSNFSRQLFTPPLLHMGEQGMVYHHATLNVPLPVDISLFQLIN